MSHRFTRDCKQFIAHIQKATLHGNGTQLHGTFTQHKACCTNTPISFADPRSGSADREQSIAGKHHMEFNMNLLLQ